MSQAKLPRHIAIIMDGNGRWAKQRSLPRIAGHKAGVKSVRRAIQACGEKGIEVLTLFAFSSENWARPPSEVNDLMDLFLSALKRETKKLHSNNVQIRFIGDCSRFSSQLKQWICDSQLLTKNNTGLKLIIAANYGGRWDIVNAAKQLAQKISDGEVLPEEITVESFEKFLALADLPEPDLFIRTSGELRISNFLLWQLAYTELYFTNILWPDFDSDALDEALNFFASRERRFGITSEQLTTTI